MTNSTNARRGSLFLPLIIMVLGAFFLLANLLPNINTWHLFSRWWPLLLVLVGLGKIWDHVRLRNNPDAVPVMGITGWGIALLLIVCFVGFGMSRGSRGRDMRGSRDARTSHNSESIDRHGNESVRVEVEMDAG